MIAQPSLSGFFFRPVSASGWGLLRMGFGALVFAWMLMKLPDVTHTFTNQGYMHLDLGEFTFRNQFRFSLLDYATQPASVYPLYALLLLSAISTAIGWKPRLSVAVTTLLLFSFQERNLFPLGGGDTVLRTLGFLLTISPELRAFSVGRIRPQWMHWKKRRELLPPLTMPAWPYRLLLWQVMIVYLASGWEKASGSMWWDGTAVAAAYHHTHFALWPKPVMDLLSAFSRQIGYATLLWEFGWVLLLVPRSVGKLFPPGLRKLSCKRLLIFAGIVFHGGIFLTMRVGVFSPAMMLAYVGLLLDDDFRAIRTHLNRRWGSLDRIAILYDGHCGFCTRSVFALHLTNHLDRLQLVDFHDTAARKKLAPELRFEDLDKAMHIKLPDGSVMKGFDAFRRLAWHLPALWPTVPLLYLPGAAPIGRRIYARISERRRKCTHESCGL